MKVLEGALGVLIGAFTLTVWFVCRAAITRRRRRHAVHPEPPTHRPTCGCPSPPPRPAQMTLTRVTFTPVWRLEERERLGQLVRETWCAWAREQPNPKPGWLVPWAELCERDKEVDRRIGVAVAEAVYHSLVTGAVR